MLPMMGITKNWRSIGSIHRLQIHWRKLSKHKWEELYRTFQRILEDHQTMVIRGQGITKAHHVLTQTWKDGYEHEMLYMKILLDKVDDPIIFEVVSI
jgi:hypothetical protein